MKEENKTGKVVVGLIFFLASVAFIARGILGFYSDMQSIFQKNNDTTENVKHHFDCIDRVLVSGGTPHEILLKCP